MKSLKHTIDRTTTHAAAIANTAAQNEGIALIRKLNRNAKPIFVKKMNGVFTTIFLYLLFHTKV